jgi:hypothetical protein
MIGRRAPSVVCKMRVRARPDARPSDTRFGA